jgi:hypothetical protein
MSILDAKLVKVLNGEEIIAEVVKEDDEYITLKNPAIVMLSPGQDGNVTVQMGPYCPHTSKTIPMRKSLVLFVVEPDSELVNGYNKAFGSGLVLPNQTLTG